MDITRIPAKGIYLANRHPRMTREEFRARWMQHSRIGEAVRDPRLESSVSSLRYCLTVDPAGILPAATDEHDGVALLALRGLAVLPALHAMVTGNDIAYADELRVFERPVEHTKWYAVSDLAVEGAETEVAVLELARRRVDVEPFAFARAGADADERERRLALSGLREHGLRRWVHNALCAPGPRGFAYDAVNELWFDSIEAVAAAGDAIERFLEAGSGHTSRNASIVLVTTVIHRIGRDRP